MGGEPRFAADLYGGAADHYDRYRLSYPEAMTGDLIQRAGVSGDGRLLDLGCGTGQLAFPLGQWFSEAWAVDREPDMVRVVRAKAEALGAGNIRPVVADAETLDAQPGYFELAVIGNAFHRLDRDLVATRLLRWLRPGGCVALCCRRQIRITVTFGPSRAHGNGGDGWRGLLARREPLSSCRGTRFETALSARPFRFEKGPPGHRQAGFSGPDERDGGDTRMTRDLIAHDRARTGQEGNRARRQASIGDGVHEHRAAHRPARPGCPHDRVVRCQRRRDDLRRHKRVGTDLLTARAAR